MKQLLIWLVPALAGVIAFAAPGAAATDPKAALESVDAFCARQLSVCTASGPLCVVATGLLLFCRRRRRLRSARAE